MKFTDLEKEMIIALHDLHPTIKETAVAFCEEQDIKFTDSIRRSVSKLLEKKGVTNNRTLLVDTDEYKEATDRKLKKSKYYLITYEQNKTPLHAKFFKNLVAYKDFLGAELSVIVGLYQNTSSSYSKNGKENWNEATRPYWDAARQEIHPFATLLADANVIPTAASPLTRFEMITRDKTAIIGAPKLHLKSMPVLEHRPKKILLTTGACTVPNYSNTKAGKIAESHHKLGFVIVEVKDDETFFIRQVEALTKDGSFIDLIHSVKGGKVKKIKKAKALTWGDTHVGSLDPEKEEGSYKLQKALNIRTEIHHDITDGHSVNNHLVKDPIGRFHRHVQGKDDVAAEIENVKAFVKKTIKRGVKRIIVPAANHNDRFDRWLNSTDWKKDIINAKAYMELASIMLDVSKVDETNCGILAYILDEAFPKHVTNLHANDSCKIGPIEYSQHGHIGTNGSRGSFVQFAKANVPMVVAHSHTPMRINDALAAGTSTFLREGYNKGMSSWLHADVLHHNNDTLQQIIYVDGGEFTTFEL
jgi:hypothetical protein